MFDYDAHKSGLPHTAHRVVETIERIGTLLNTTGVFKVSDVVVGDSWDCLLVIRLLHRQGFIKCVEPRVFTQDYIFTKDRS